MKSRVAAGVLAVVVAVGLVAVGLVGCSGGAPKPSPTPTPPFANADAAYKAAEATYREYVDAGNHVDLADEKTFAPLFGWLVGDALETDRAQVTGMASKGWRWTGDSRITLIEPSKTALSDPLWGEVHLSVCLDVHAIKVTDRGGVSVVAKDRPDVQALAVDFVHDDTSPTGLKIIGLNKRTDAPACGG